MSEFDGLRSYSTDTEGNRTEGEFAPPLRDDEPAPPAAGHHPDGSRTWRFVDAADPRQWSDSSTSTTTSTRSSVLAGSRTTSKGYFWTLAEAIGA